MKKDIGENPIGSDHIGEDPNLYFSNDIHFKSKERGYLFY